MLKVIGYEVDYTSNSNKEYFDIDLFEFTNVKKNNTYNFPHEFLSNNINISYNFMEIVFIIFESVYMNNHLNNLNKKLPYHYMNFKKLILNYLIKIND